jgi:hypothetical protein
MLSLLVEALEGGDGSQPDVAKDGGGLTEVQPLRADHK